MPLTNEEMDMILKWSVERREVADAVLDALPPAEQHQYVDYVNARSKNVDERLKAVFREMADDGTLGEVMEMYREQYGDEPTEK